MLEAVLDHHFRSIVLQPIQPFRPILLGVVAVAKVSAWKLSAQGSIFISEEVVPILVGPRLHKCID